MIHKLLAASLLALMATTSLAHAETAPAYSEGHGYKRVPQPAKPDAQKVTVEEFFWYGCPHCYRFEPVVSEWRKKLPADVKFVRVPNNLGHPQGMVHEQAFYIADFLGIEEKIHAPLMDALVRDHKPLVTLESIRDFYVEVAKIKPADFDSAANNFIVAGNMERADQEAMDYQITGVPTVIVDGTYQIEPEIPADKVKNLKEEESEKLNYAEVLKIADFLIKKQRAERKLKP